MPKQDGEMDGATASDVPKPYPKKAAVWTSTMKRDFLSFLAATCNIKAAAAHVGLTQVSVYTLRARDKPFRARWADALEQGYQMLETRLVGHALAGGGPVLADDDVTGPIDVKLAQALLAAHHGRQQGDPRRRGGPEYKKVTSEQTDASILRKLRAMTRGDERKR